FAKMKHFTIRSFIVSIFPHMIGFIPIMVGLLLCIITPILILFTPLNPSSNYYTSPFIKVAAIPAGVLIASVVFLVLLLTGFFAIIYFFPPYNFCWGDYLTTFQKKQSTGKYILTVVIFGLVLSVAGSIIATLITK
ncbi:MAG TPA: hypothetical protein VEP90_00670, partial [Methylomirabilota bacterium]|nr:hypothetical protein [Methylomirabilota bacterium]